jgi:hypothetical protein
MCLEREGPKLLTPITSNKNLQVMTSVATPLWKSVRMTLTFPKWGLGSPKNSEFDCRGQNTFLWSVLYIVGKVLKCRCRKWPCMSHSNICSTSYGWKKGRKSNWQFNSRPLKVGNWPDPTPVCAGGVQHTIKKLLRRATSLLETSSRSRVWTTNYELPKSREFKSRQFWDYSLGVPGKSAIRM